MMVSAATPLPLSVRDLRVSTASGSANLEVSEFDVEHGSVHILVGGSGAGKSTLLRVCVGLVPLRGRRVSGCVRWNDFDVLSATPADRAQYRRRHIGYVSQDPFQALNPAYSVIEHLRDAVHDNGPSPTAIEALERSGLDSRFAKRYPEELSGGERQRVQIALAICRAPQVVFADEPTSGLDTDTAVGVTHALIECATSLGAALVVSTHDLTLAQRLEGTTSIIWRTIVESGSQVLSNPRTESGQRLADASNRYSSVRRGNDGDFGQEVLRAENLTYVIKQEKGDFRPILDKIDLRIRARESVGIYGPSGAGKTTLIRILAGLNSPTSGSVVRPRPGQRVGFVPQDAARSLNPRFTVASILNEVINSTAPAKGIAPQPWTIETLLTAVELPVSVANRTPTALSGGERQRVAIARALATSPAILLLDEPVTALDMITKETVSNLVESLQDTYGFGMLIISHEREALQRLCHRALHLRNGRLVPGLLR